MTIGTVIAPPQRKLSRDQPHLTHRYNMSAQPFPRPVQLRPPTTRSLTTRSLTTRSLTTRSAAIANVPHGRRLFVVVAVVGALLVQMPQVVAQPAAASAADGDADRVSDWAQAGLMWSQAHYAKKVARTAANLQSGQIAEDHRKTAAKLDNLIGRLEDFGWKRLDRSPNGTATPRTAPAVEPATRHQPRSQPETAASIDPAAVQRNLRRELGFSTTKQPTAAQQVAGQSTAIDRTDLPRAVVNDDRDNPAFDRRTLPEPGANDETVRDLETIDIQHYRVDDVVDETPAERRNIADAIEDGVETAIAAGIDTAKIPNVGRISNREMQTRSSTMAYSVDSIYDGDDRNTDRDYVAERPLGPATANDSGLAAINNGLDGVDDIDNEDELATAIIGGDQTTTPDQNILQANRLLQAERNPLTQSNALTAPDAVPDADHPEPRNATAPLTPQQMRSQQKSSSTPPVDRSPRRVRQLASTTPDAANRRDADWVDLALETYQTRWNMLTSGGQPSPAVLESQLQAIEIEMRATARSISRNAESEPLRQLAGALADGQ